MKDWLVKQEPEGPKGYPFEQFCLEKQTAWTGIRNFQARNHLRAMQKGDFVFYYHSNIGKAIVGTAQVIRTAYPDPTAEEGDWSCVDLQAGQALSSPISLEQIKAHPVLKDMILAKHSRLSVMPITKKEKEVILQLSQAKA